jgi:hypothetical protein
MEARTGFTGSGDADHDGAVMALVLGKPERFRPSSLGRGIWLLAAAAAPVSRAGGPFSSPHVIRQSLLIEPWFHQRREGPDHAEGHPAQRMPLHGQAADMAAGPALASGAAAGRAGRSGASSQAVTVAQKDEAPASP